MAIHSGEEMEEAMRLAKPAADLRAQPGTITPQAALVLDYLTSGRKLTPLVAHMTLGVASLTARIAELRKNGHTIQDAWEADHFNRRYKGYWMQPPGQPHP